MRLEVVHEQVVSVVNEEVKCVNHFAVVANERHLNCLFDYFDDRLFRFGLFLKKLDVHLFFRFFEQKVGFSDDLVRLFQSLFDLGGLLEYAYEVSSLEFTLLLLEELLTRISLLV